jgi:RNA polymerase sigma-70 factor (ECF subfamily)
VGAIERAHAEGRARWPKVTLPLEDFRAFAEGKSLEGQGAEVFLAAACAQKDPAALREFERHYLAQVTDFVAKTDPSPAFADEVKQVLRERLFVDGMHIRDYSGAGPLGAWLRVVSARTALNLKRGKKNAGPPEQMPINAPVIDPELDYLKSRYGAEFREAFRKVLSSLPPRDKSLLSLYYLEGLSSAAIAATFKVHGATVRRWVEEVRGQIVEETYALLKGRLDLSSNEMKSLMKVLHSQLEQSIGRLLK